MPLLTIIGRGHSGTRAIAQTLYASDVFMGSRLNRSADLVPPEPMYQACRVMARHVRLTGDADWDFAMLHDVDIPAEFHALVDEYLSVVMSEHALHPDRWHGWKLPETTLVFPWIRRLYPDAHYIHWVRDPRDSILSFHMTDDLTDFGVPMPPSGDERERRALSWKYQHDIVEATPRPANWIDVRFEDFVLDQEHTVRRLEAFLGIRLARIPVRSDSIGRWTTDGGRHDFDVFGPAMREHGYGPAGPPVAPTAVERLRRRVAALRRRTRDSPAARLR